MRQIFTMVLAFVLLASGGLSPRLDAAYAAALTKVGCRATKHQVPSCCCGHAVGVRCPCEVAPSTPRPQPLERASISSSSECPALALAPSHIGSPARERVSLTVIARFGRHRHVASAGPRLHLLEGVFRE